MISIIEYQMQKSNRDLFLRERNCNHLTFFGNALKIIGAKQKVIWLLILELLQ